MRPDMAKVIVERPRYGSRNPSRKKGYRKYVQSCSLEDLPRNEPLLGRWRGREKWLNEHLGPMRRFLRSNVGRPWNHVHRDLCEFVSFDNAVQSHVLDHIYDFVHQHVKVTDGATVYAEHRWWRGRKLGAGDMYICPTTGLLKVVRPNRRRQPITRIAGNDFMQFLFRDNAWWEVRLREKSNEADDLWDVWLEREAAKLTDRDCMQVYGGKFMALSKRPLTRLETKQLYRKLRRTKGRK